MENLIERALLGLKEAKLVSFEEWSIQNRKMWESLGKKVKDEIIERGRNCSFSNDDYISLSLFREFSENGNRSHFEEIYFEKRRKLSDLVIAECVENKGSFIAEIEEGIWSLLSEIAWVIPAHNSYIRDRDALDTPLIDRPVLDLFACETGEILALSIAVLKDRLNPIIVKDVYSEIERRIIRPYIEDSFWWMGQSGRLMNWSPWCTQNVLIAGLTNPLTDEKTRMKIVKQAISTLDGFISSYSQDGACDEGATYYHAATLTLFGAILILEKSTEKDFSNLYEDQKFFNMASYIEDVFIKDDLYLNYADCSPKAGALGAREYLLAKKTANEKMAYHAAKDFMHYGWREDDNNYNLYYKLIALFNYNEIKEEAEKEIKYEEKPFKVFKERELAIYRFGGITFAIKGGSNGESHNHNDVGSIILYNEAKPLIIDIGVETYTKKTFSSDRYTLSPMRSLYHNVVNFPPLEQKAGAKYKAKDVLFTEHGATLNLTDAYEGIELYIRTLNIDREKREISITEEIKSNERPILSLISQERPERVNNTIDYESFAIEFSDKIKAEIEVMDITDPRLLKAWPEKLYRTLIEIPKYVTWKIRIKEER